jgi:hypothetical protein
VGRTGPGRTWRHLGRSVLAGLVVAGVVASWVALDLHHHHDGLVSLLQPGAQEQAAAVVGHDFPGVHLPAGYGNDGQGFYAVARDLPHFHHVAASLDRPRYRLQRPGYPFLAWLLHPTGGGSGLIVAMLVVNLGGLVVGGVALGDWARSGGRSTWWGLVLLATPGAYLALRISCADALAVSLALAAVMLSRRGHLLAAAAIAVLAGLTKEVSLLVLAGPALWAWRSGARRSAVVLFGPAVAAVGALWLILLLAFPGGHQYGEFGAPLTGLLDAARYWRAAGDWKPALTVTATVFAAIVSLRKPTGPFAVSVALLLGLTVLLSMRTLAYWTSAPRVLLPLGVCTLAHWLDKERSGAPSGSERTDLESLAMVPLP